MQVHYKNTELNTRASKTNIVLAAFVTSHARLELLAELRKFSPSQIIYYDTGIFLTILVFVRILINSFSKFFKKDSIIFSHKPGEYKPNLGNNLGQFTDEINKKKGNFIRRFVSGGKHWDLLFYW